MTETNPCHPAEQQARQDRLDQAYLESGRTNGVYTGLLTTPEPAPVPEATAETKLVRVVRREFYDAFGATTYYLRVPVGMTAEEIEQHDCWHDGIDKDSHPYRDGLVCVGRVNGSDADVIATLEPTDNRDTGEVTEITEADLLLETEESASEEEVEPRPDICRACRFWYKYPAHPGGECRRYAPRAVAVTEKDIEEAEDNHPERFVWFIETSADDWCGEFEPKVQANG